MSLVFYKYFSQYLVLILILGPIYQQFILYMLGRILFDKIHKICKECMSDLCEDVHIKKACILLYYTSASSFECDI